MDADNAQQGGVATVYALPSNLALFDMSGALDKDLSDGSRGLLWRILALHARHLRIHGLSQPFRIWMKELISGATGGREEVRAYLRELAEHGYVRRWKERDEGGVSRWVTEASATPLFDGDQLREGITPIDVVAPKRVRKPAGTPKVVKPKPKALPGYHDLMAWLEDPEGGDSKIVGKEFSRVGRSINTIIEIAIKRAWVVYDAAQDNPDGVDTRDLLFYVEECWYWIKAGTPFRGAQDVHNIAAKLNIWWNEEGKQKFGNEQTPANEYHTIAI